MKIVFGLLMTTVLLAAAPASAEICSKIGSGAFKLVPQNVPAVPHDDASPDGDAMTARGEREADLMIRQMVGRDGPMVVYHIGGAEAGWPCAARRPLRLKDEVVRQDSLDLADDVAVGAGLGVVTGGRLFGTASAVMFRDETKKRLCLEVKNARQRPDGESAKRRVEKLDDKAGAPELRKSSNIRSGGSMEKSAGDAFDAASASGRILG